jgi:hypothetical protein
MVLQPDVWLDMFAKEIKQQPRVHNRKGYVGFTISDVEMASGDSQRIVPAFLFQMDSEHVDASIRKAQVKLEPLNQPATLRLLHLDIETEA